MFDLITQGLAARADWRGYHSAIEEADPRYHNRPDCVDGAAIEDENIREGTDGRPLCEKCHSAMHPDK
jgi:hypothetical protein